MKTNTAEANRIEFQCTKESAEVFREWLKTNGRENTIAACCGTITAAIGMLTHLCGEREACQYIQRKADGIIDSELPR